MRLALKGGRNGRGVGFIFRDLRVGICLARGISFRDYTILFILAPTAYLVATYVCNDGGLYVYVLFREHQSRDFACVQRWVGKSLYTYTPYRESSVTTGGIVIHI